MSKIESSELFYGVAPVCGAWVAHVRVHPHNEAVMLAAEAMLGCPCDLVSMALSGGVKMEGRTLLAWSFPGRGCAQEH